MAVASKLIHQYWHTRIVTQGGGHATGYVGKLNATNFVDAAVAGLEAGEFLITPTAQSLDMFRAKAADIDGFHANLRERLRDAGALHGS